MVLVLRLYFREQRSTLYTVITAGVAVEVGSGAVGRVVMVKLGLAAGRAVKGCECMAGENHGPIARTLQTCLLLSCRQLKLQIAARTQETA